ncbi:MAG: hypothetical protein VX643_00180 [Chloroflexota bacterium]|nr:hypothetical protein [Chloroflexota bacterium]
MDLESTPEVSVETVFGFSQLAALGHDRAYLVELTPIIEEQLNKLSSLWQIDVRGYEMTMIFSVITAWGLEKGDGID